MLKLILSLMIIDQVKFLTSNTDPGKCPPATKPEYAFIGRSNVGKSSLINLLVNRKGMAKISGKPGKTQTINHFIINDAWYLVDLPGYGYAKVSKKARNQWMESAFAYLEHRKNLMTLFVLIDSRIEPQAIDLEFLDLLGEAGIPFALVFTKTDKVSINEANSNKAKFLKEMKKSWEFLPISILSSTINRTGRDEILKYIDDTNKLFRKS